MNSDYRIVFSKVVPVVAAVVLLLALAPASVSRAQIAVGQVVQKTGDEQGLCVIIGCGTRKSSTLAADVAKQSKLLVHGIALDDDSLARARKAISAAGVDGLATVEKLHLTPLPYRDNIANIVVVPDFKVAAAAGLTTEEALRVTAPKGRLIVNTNGKVTTTVKPMPKEMDEWTHENRGPDGNTVSSDTAVHFPVGFRWNAGLPMNINNPKQSANAWSSTRGIALCNGRCFTLSSSVLENLGPTFGSKHGVDQYVIARDAFNGLLLWRTKVGATYYGGLFYPNRAPFVAVGDYVYAAAEDGKLIALDAATGRIARKFDTTYPVGKVLVDQNVVVAATWKEGTKVGGLFGVDRRLMDFAIAEGAVEAFDAGSGNRLWKLDKLATFIRSADGNLYMVQREGADKREEQSYPSRPPKKEGEQEPPPPPSRPEQYVVAVDLKTGKQLWEARVAKAGAHEILSVDAAGMGVVAIAHNNGARTTVLSAKDGHVVLETAAHSYAGFAGGELHLGGKKYDPATGKETGTSPVRISSTICTPTYYVNNMTVQNRGGGFNVDGKHLLYGGARGACLFASIPAYGEFYTAQNWCACAPAQIPGFIAFGPISREPNMEEMETPAPPEQGPAYRKISGLKPQTSDSANWPMYRRDPFRSNATPGSAPQKLDLLWQKTVTVPWADGAMGCEWKEQLTDPLTSPVVGDRIVIVAVPDRNQVIALNAATGKEEWRQVVGGRVDSAPTLYGGACLFGSHDGYVYALSRADGRLAWKLRAAPCDERMVSYGKVESPWPVMGTVLVDDGMAYASAGRTQGSDGGIVVRAFDPGTGKIAWSRAIVPTSDGGEYRNMRKNDIILKVGDSLQLMRTRMNPKSGEIVKNPTIEYQKALEQQRREKQQAEREAKKSAVPGKKTEAAKKTEPADEELKPPEEIAPGIGLEGFVLA